MAPQSSIALDSIELPTEPQTRLKLGQKWNSLETAKWDCKKWVLDRRESWDTTAARCKSDKLRFSLLCKNLDCEFKIYVRWNQKEQKATLSRLAKHTCPRNTHHGFKMANSAKYMAHHHAGIIQKEPKITSSMIQSLEVDRYQRKGLSRHQAWRVKQHVKQMLYGQEIEGFQKLRSYLDLLVKIDPWTYTNLKLDENTGAFQALFVALGPMRKAFKHLRHFYGIDGAHTRTKYKRILVLFVGIDADDKVFPLAIGIIPTENEFWWCYIAGHVLQAFPILKRPRYQGVIVSDRDKGLRNAIEAILRRLTHSHCTQHIADNIQVRYGRKARNAFWPIARARTPKAFWDLLSEFKKVSKPAYEYLKAIERDTYALAFFPLPRFGHDTNNITESINGVWIELRNLPILQMLDG